jgi:hypothetical protein
MSSELAITAATNRIDLNGERRAETSFTVSNASGRPLRARVRVAPTAPALPDWFGVGGEAERPFPADGTQQFTVQIAVPPEAATGSYAFRLDALNLENPDGDYVQGPAVAFEVADKPTIVRARKGYLATLLGTVVGVLAGVAVGFLLGGIVGGLLGGSGSGVGGVVSTVLTWALALGGGIFGAGLALRMGNYQHFMETVIALAIALPLWAGLVALVLLLIGSPGILQGGGTPALILLCVSGPVALAVPPLAARGAALFMRTGRL